MTDKTQETGHWFANHGLGWAVSDESREAAIEKLLHSSVTPPDWPRDCLKGGNALTVYSCYVPVDIEAPYKIRFCVPQVEGVRDGANHMVTYMTKTKHALMRDPSDAEYQRRREAEAELERRKSQLRTLAYAVAKQGEFSTQDVKDLLAECFEDRELFPGGEDESEEEQEPDLKAAMAIDTAKQLYMHDDDVRINDTADSDCEGGSWVSADIWISEQDAETC